MRVAFVGDGGVLTAGRCAGVETGAWLGVDTGDTGRCVSPPVVLWCGGRAEGAGSGEGDGAGVVAGACCGLGPAACAAVIGSTADITTTAVVRLILGHPAMVHGNGDAERERCAFPSARCCPLL